MKRIAVIGGGIAGLSAAYELTRQQQAGAPLDFTLFEASPRLGGIVETVRRDGFVIECGPDSWVTEKPWARELAVELGLEADLIFSRDEQRRTYLAESLGEQGTLCPLPEGLRMGIPVEWASVLSSPLISQQAKLAYQQEPARAEELKASALDASTPPRDESVRNFFLRHFGNEVTATIIAPLWAGVFGGDIARLGARAVLPPSLLRLEQEYGSLIFGLQHGKSDRKPLPIFTTLREGLAGIVESMRSHVPSEKIRLTCPVLAIERSSNGWKIILDAKSSDGTAFQEEFDSVVIAAPAATTAALLAPLDSRCAELLPGDSTSAIVVALGYPEERAKKLFIPSGFGFLVSQGSNARRHIEAGSMNIKAGPGNRKTIARQSLLACTFVDQKFGGRVPSGGRLMRAFFAGPSAPALMPESDDTLQVLARDALGNFLGVLPEPSISVVRRWPRSLPLYTVGHVERIAELKHRVAELPGLYLIGNAYHGVGLPDLIRDGRNAAREATR